jgi:hypothetical protein
MEEILIFDYFLPGRNDRPSTHGAKAHLSVQRRNSIAIDIEKKSSRKQKPCNKEEGLIREKVLGSFTSMLSGSIRNEMRNRRSQRKSKKES